MVWRSREGYLSAPGTDAILPSMIPVTQTITEKGRGNCFAACIASLLHLECDEVPNFVVDYDENWLYECGEWLKQRGYSLLVADPKAQFWLATGVLCVASVKSKRFEGGRHAVVVELNYGDAKLIHDPHPSRDGYDGDPFYYYFLLSTGPKS